MNKIDNFLDQINLENKDYEKSIFILNNLSNKMNSCELDECIKLIKESSKLQSLLKIIVEKI